MSPRVAVIPDDARGIDINAPVTPALAANIKAAGFRYVYRYIPRLSASTTDLSAAEVKALHRAGLAVGAVQHVINENTWTPTPDTGVVYGRGAVKALQTLAVPKGTTVFCDLEGVVPGTPADDVAGYVNAWSLEVERAGYEAGLYCGWRAGLDAAGLYQRCRVRRYWAAYNLDADEYPIQRGVCMKQHGVTAAEIVSGAPRECDTITAHVDALGGRASVWAPDGWSATC